MGGDYPSDNSDLEIDADSDTVSQEQDQPRFVHSYPSERRRFGNDSESDYDSGSDQDPNRDIDVSIDSKDKRIINSNENSNNNSKTKNIMKMKTSGPMSHESQAEEYVEENARISQFETVANLLQYQKRVMYADCGVAFDLAIKYIDTKEAQDFLDACMYGVVDIFLQQRANTVRKGLLIHFEKVFSGSVRAALWDLKTNNGIRYLKSVNKIFNHREWFYSDDVEVKPIGQFGNKTRKRMIQLFLENNGCRILHDMLKGSVPVKRLDGIDEMVYVDNPDVTISGSPAKGKEAKLLNAGRNELSGEEIYLIFSPLCAAYGDIPVEYVKNSADLVMNNLSNMSENMLKKQRSEVLSSIHECLRTVLGDNNIVLKQFLMALSVKTLNSKSFPLRKLGLDMICKFAVAADRHTRVSPRFANGQSASNCGDDEDVFNETVFKPWLLENHVLESLFGSKEGESDNETHPVLVGRSKDLFYYMIRQNILLPSHIDMIFKSSLKQHESVRGAVQTLLAEIAMDKEVSDELAAYVLYCARLLVLGKTPNSNAYVSDANTNGKIRIREGKDILIDSHNKTQAEENDGIRDNDMMFFTEKLMRAEQQLGNYHQFSNVKPNTMSSLLELLWSLLESCNSLDDPKKDQLMEYLVIVLHSGNARNKLESFMDRCTGILQAAANQKHVYLHNERVNQDVIVFVAYEVLRNIINFYRTNEDFMGGSTSKMSSTYNNEDQYDDVAGVTANSISQTKVIERLQESDGLLQLVVNETKAYMRRYNSSLVASKQQNAGTESVNINKVDPKGSLKKSSDRRESVRTNQHALHMKALRGRLGFLRFCLGRSCLNLSFELVDSLWQTLTHPEEREMYMVWLRRVAVAESGGSVGIGGDERDINGGFQSGLAPQVIRKVFTNLLCEQTIDEFRTFSEQSFKCFSYFFLDVNSQSEMSRHGDSGGTFVGGDEEIVETDSTESKKKSKEKKSSSLFGGFGFGKTSKRSSNPPTSTPVPVSSKSVASISGTSAQLKTIAPTFKEPIGLETLWRIIIYAPQATSLRAMKLLLLVQCRIEESLSLRDVSGTNEVEEKNVEMLVPDTAAVEVVEEEDVNIQLPGADQSIDGNEKVSAGHENRLCLQKRIEFLNKMFTLLSQVAQADTIKVRRCVQLIMSYLEMFPLPSNIAPHLRPLGPEVELIVHHQMVLLHSKRDIGKMLQQVVPISYISSQGSASAGTGQQLQWLRGVVVDYDAFEGTHEILYIKTGKTARQNLRRGEMNNVSSAPIHSDNFSDSGMINGAYKMVRNPLLGNKQVSADERRGSPLNHMSERVQKACAAYVPFRFRVKERITLKALKAAILDITGCRRNPRSTLSLSRMAIDVQIEHQSDSPNCDDYDSNQNSGRNNPNFNSIAQNNPHSSPNALNTDSEHVRRLTMYPEKKSICEILPTRPAYTVVSPNDYDNHTMSSNGEVLNGYVLFVESVEGGGDSVSMSPGGVSQTQSKDMNIPVGTSNNYYGSNCSTFEFQYFGADADLPPCLVTQKGSKYATILMDLLDSPAISNDTRIELWGLLMALPTDRTQVDHIFKFGVDNISSLTCSAWETHLGLYAQSPIDPDYAGSDESGSSNISNNRISVLRTVYLLMIADQLLLSSSLEKSEPTYSFDISGGIGKNGVTGLVEWRESFLNNGGFEAVCRLLSRMLNIEPKPNNSEKHLGCNSTDICSSTSYVSWQQRVSLPVLVRIVKFGIALSLSKSNSSERSVALKLPGNVSSEFIMQTLARVMNLGHQTSILNKTRRKLKRLMLKRRKSKATEKRSLNTTNSNKRNHRYVQMKHHSKHQYGHNGGRNRSFRVSFSEDFSSICEEDNEDMIDGVNDGDTKNNLSRLEIDSSVEMCELLSEEIADTCSTGSGREEEETTSGNMVVLDEDDAAILRVLLDTVKTATILVNKVPEGDALSSLVRTFFEQPTEYLTPVPYTNHTTADGANARISPSLSGSYMTALDILLLSGFSTFREKLKELVGIICDRSQVGCELVEKKALVTFETRLPIQCKTCADFFECITNLVTCAPSTSEGIDENVNKNVRGRLFAVCVAKILIKYPAPSKEQQLKESKVVSSFENNPSAMYTSNQPQAGKKSSASQAFKTATQSLVDQTLIGLLQLLKLLLNRDTAMIPDNQVFAQLAGAIMSRYLLATPSADKPDNVAVATLYQTREASFSLLKILSDNCPQILTAVAEINTNFVQLMPIPLNRQGRQEWNFKSTDAKRSPFGFVGLVNEGATCYQNSVLQQLSMCPAVCKAIKDAAGPLPSLVEKQKHDNKGLSDADAYEGHEEEDDDGDEEEDMNYKTESGSRRGRLLYALQQTLVFLGASQRRCFNPIKFVNCSATLKLTDGHLRQNDAIEFYSRLIDYLEINMKDHRDQKDVLKNLLYVRTCTMNVRHCEGKHRTESEVGTPFLTLNIRSGMAGPTLHSLEEALDSWFKSEKLTGLTCEECDLLEKQTGSADGNEQVPNDAGDEENVGKRYDADQVKCFSKLPPVLVVQLQRFDFDYEMMQPTKLNHRVSFERKLDLGRFTKNAVMRQVFDNKRDDEESTSNSGESEETTPDHKQCESGTEYELRGVVVHQGSGANFGHYYSFIMDRKTGSWFRFDDERVYPFDIANLEEECFGGIYDGTSPGWQPHGTGMNNQFSRSQKDNNAYLLLYERVDLDVNVGSNGSPSADIVYPCGINKPKLEGVICNSEPSSKTENYTHTRSCLSFAFVARMTHQLQLYKRKAQSKIAAKCRAKTVQKKVWEDNQRTLRHALVLAADFLDFVLLLIQRANALVVKHFPDDFKLFKLKGDNIVKNVDAKRLDDLKEVSFRVIRMGVITFVKAAIRVATQKAKLRLWLPALKRLLFLNMKLTLIGDTIVQFNPNYRTVENFNGSRWFLLHLSNDEEARNQWLKPLIMYCLEPQAREQFAQLFLYVIALTKQRYMGSGDNIEEAEEIKSFMSTMADIMPEGHCNCKLLTPYLRIWRAFISQNKDCPAVLATLHGPIIDLPGALMSLYISNDPNAIPASNINSPNAGSASSPNNIRMGGIDNPGNSQLAGGIGGNPNQYADFEAMVETISLLITGHISDKSTLANEGYYDEVTKLRLSIGLEEHRCNQIGHLDELDVGGYGYWTNELCAGNRFPERGFELGLSLLSENAKAMFSSGEFYIHLCRRDPGIGGEILAARCRGDNVAADAIARELIDGLKCVQSTQTSVSTMSKDQIKDICRGLQCVLNVYDAQNVERTRFIVESLLKLCISYRKGADMMLMAINKGNIGGSNVNIPYLQEERSIARAIYVHAVYHIAKLFGQIVNQHELVRGVLWKYREHWAWLPEWVDQHTYDPDLNGNHEVFTRSVAKGKTARLIAKAYYACHCDMRVQSQLSLQTVLCIRVIIKGAGTEAVNGIYEFDGYFEPGASDQVDTVTPKWCKVTDGVRYTLYRCRVKDRNFTWYISNLSNKPGTNRDVDYYSSQKNQPNPMPPLIGWTVCKKGSKPAPRIQIVRNRMNPTDDPLKYMKTPKEADVNVHAGISESQNREHLGSASPGTEPASAASSPDVSSIPGQMQPQRQMLHMQIRQQNTFVRNTGPGSPNSVAFQHHRRGQNSTNFHVYSEDLDREPAEIHHDEGDDADDDSSSYSSSSLN